jgi:hypothetical protein
VLTDGTITYFENPSTIPPYGVGEKGKLTLIGSKIEIGKGNNRLFLSTPVKGEDCLMEATTTAERDSWIAAITEHINHYNSSSNMTERLSTAQASRKSFF